MDDKLGVQSFLSDMRRIRRKLRPATVAVYNNANQACANGWHILTFNTERWDVDGYHSLVANTSRLTIPAGYGGPHTFTGHVILDASGAGTRRGLSILLNGATYLGYTESPFAAGKQVWMSICVQWNAADGDFFELTTYQDTGGVLNAINFSAGGIEFRCSQMLR